MINWISNVLQNATSEYQDLYDGIKGFGTWWHQTESVWMIKTEKSAKEVRDYLMKFLDVPGKIEANGQSNLDIDLYSELLNKGQVNVTELADKYHVDAKKIKDVAKEISKRGSLSLSVEDEKISVVSRCFVSFSSLGLADSGNELNVKQSK